MIHGKMEAKILKLGSNSKKEYYFQDLVGASQERDGAIVTWFNGHALHSAPLALNLVHNTLVRISLGDDHGIYVSNKPFPFPSKMKSEREILPFNFGQVFGISLVVVLSILSATYIQFYVEVKC